MVALVFARIPAWAQDQGQVQALLTGDGLVGTYYRGPNFNQLDTIGELVLSHCWRNKSAEGGLTRLG